MIAQFTVLLVAVFCLSCGESEQPTPVESPVHRWSYSFFPARPPALLSEEPVKIEFDTAELELPNNPVVAEYQEVNEAEYDYSKCLPWVPDGQDASEKLKALLTSLGVQDLDGLWILGWSTHYGNALHLDSSGGIGTWVFTYALSGFDKRDGFTQRFAVSAISVDYANCEFTLLPNK